MSFKDTKFYKWLTYNRPDALTLPEWDEFYNEFKRNAPVRYFFFVYLGSKIRSIFGFYGCINDWWWKIKYRTIKRYHLIDTKLKPNYYDKDILMLHGCFSLLEDYVEVECAHMEYCTEEYNSVLTWARFPRLKKFWLRTFKHPKRSREYGLKYLEWAARLDDPNMHPMDRAHGQADAARKAMELYKWWKDIRPNRKYPDDPAEEIPMRDILYGRLQRNDPELHEAYRKYLDALHALDEQWDEEDDEMLAKLAAIRKDLWT